MSAVTIMHSLRSNNHECHFLALITITYQMKPLNRQSINVLKGEVTLFNHITNFMFEVCKYVFSKSSMQV